MALRSGGVDEFGHERFTGVAQQLAHEVSASARRSGSPCSATFSAAAPDLV